MNLYLHVPFCRAKCAYCALASRAGTTPAQREAYAGRLAREILAREPAPPSGEAHTVYFGGGTPAYVPLTGILEALKTRGWLAPGTECTVELHPCDVTAPLVDALRANGVNRISLGVQSFDDETLRALGRGHTRSDILRACDALAAFPSVGIDLIVGLDTPPQLDALDALLPALQHVSVYTLIQEPGTRLVRAVREGRMRVADDETALAEFAAVRALLLERGFLRYEIANFSRPGFACRHNSAVWRGEDYIGLGDGAYGREGYLRTYGEKGGYALQTLSPQDDARERALFALRTAEGLDLGRVREKWPLLAPELARWEETLAFNVSCGLLTRTGETYRLTPRGAEVCDALLADLV